MLLVHVIFLGRFFPTGFQFSVYLYLLSSGFLGFFIADLLIFKAFVDLGPRETLVIMTLSPIFAALSSWLALGETLRLLQIQGSGQQSAVLSGSFLRKAPGAGEQKAGKPPKSGQEPCLPWAGP
jgi:drug/metabolite transporter (DMT)-like permease